MVVLGRGVIKSLAFMFGAEGWVDEVINIRLIIEDGEVRYIFLVPNTHVEDDGFNM